MIEHSVLLQTRDHAPFITECVDSLLAQTQPPDEIIVYDDGSTDRTVDALRCYGSRIRVIAAKREERPVHVADARAVEVAFAQSHGRLIFLLQGDDRFKLEKIERYSAAFEEHPDAAVVQAPLERIDRQGNSLGVTLDPRYHVTNHLREIYRQQDVNFFYPTSALAFSRYYLERILPLDLDDGLPLWTDARLCIPAAYYGRIITLLDPLTDWRFHTAADIARIRSRTTQIRQMFLRARVFNAFCRRHRLRTISPWRNRRLYFYLLRYAMPARIFESRAARRRPVLDWFS
jgi:glycosyltransferase involved in cell wall biosynthesis